MDLNAAIKSHSEWKMKLRSAMAAKARLPVEDIARDDCCTLGKWLHGESRKTFGHLGSHSGLLREHANFHKEAARVAKAINAGQYAEAEKALGTGSPYTTASNTVIMAIGSLKREANL